MAVMLRTLGYPTRVAVGFTSGDRSDADGLWHVTTDNAHAWVEVLFPTYGWLAFEPTPGRANPIANPYDNPSTVCSAPQGCGPNRTSPAAAPATPIRSPASGPTWTPEDGRRRGAAGYRGRRDPPEPFRFPTGLAVGVLGLLAVLVLALMPPVRVLRRRAKLRRAGHDPRARILAVYDAFASKAGAMGWARTRQTLQEYRPAAGRDRLLERRRDGPGRPAWRRAAYAPEDPQDADADAAASAAETTLRDLQRARRSGARILGWYLPERRRTEEG